MEALYVALVGFSATIVGTAITALVSYIVNKFNFNKPKKQSAREQQYLQVLAPLHKLLYFCPNITSGSSGENKNDQLLLNVEEIIDKNYPAVPSTLMACYFKSKKSNDLDEFKVLLDQYYQEAAYELGYVSAKRNLRRGKSRGKPVDVIVSYMFTSNEKKYTKFASIIAALIGAIATVIAALITALVNK